MSNPSELRKRKGKDSETTPLLAAQKQQKAPETRSSLWKIVRLVVIVAVLAELSVITWMLYVLGASGSGPHGTTTAVAEDIKSILPLHFKGLQRTMAATGCFYTNTHAKEYFEAQKPLFKASATKMQIHRYFTTLQVPKEILWNNMIHERIKAFAKLLDADGRDDYKVEKDRCKMYSFFKKNNLPICDVLGEWTSKEDFFKVLKAGEVTKLAGGDFPVFFKACHLTQSSSQGTLIISSAEKMAKGIADNSLVEWVEKKWAFRPNDFERVWVNEGNKLTDSITPAILVQGPFKQAGASWKVHGRFAVGLLEFRVEVLWGRAYLALLDGCVVFFRDGIIEDYSTPLGFLKIPVFGSEKLQWIVDEGYMDCIFTLAERAAQATATESVRYDIFLKKGDPNGCTINENSLSSGMLYWGHEDYLAQTWASGHISKGYQVLDTEMPVYELGPGETGTYKPV